MNSSQQRRPGFIGEDDYHTRRWQRTNVVLQISAPALLGLVRDGEFQEWEYVR